MSSINMHDDNSVQSLKKNHEFSSWFPEDGYTSSLLGCLSQSEIEFLRIELGERSLRDYERRLKDLGFTDLKGVLDLACGLGQWSLALARLNQSVVAIDKAMARLMVGNAIATDNGIDKISFLWSQMENLPLEDQSVDGVLCYGAFMFGKRDEVLREIHRVLKPDGIFYVNANGFGWYLWRCSLAIRGDIPRKHIFDIVIMLISTFLNRQRNRIYTKEGLIRTVAEAGFTVVSSGAEGSIGTSEAFYPGKIYGMDGVFELLCRRQ